MGVRPLQDWLVVKLDPLPETTSGGLVLPNGTSGMERQRTGTVLRVGPGVTRKGVLQPAGVSPGERIAFFRENLEHQQGKEMVRLLHELEENTGMIRQNDILFVVEEE